VLAAAGLYSEALTDGQVAAIYAAVNGAALTPADQARNCNQHIDPDRANVQRRRCIAPTQDQHISAWAAGVSASAMSLLCRRSKPRAPRSEQTPVCQLLTSRLT